MAKAKVKVEKQVSLETALMACRVALRGVGSLEKNRDAVIGLVFLKFAGDKFNARRQEIIDEHGDIPVFVEKPSFYNACNVFYLNPTSRWQYIVANAKDDKIATIIDTAMKDIADINPSLNGALSTNLYASLGANKSTIADLINQVNAINNERFHEEDIIGRTYEYFLQVYAASGTKEDGEFYTPACVVQLITEMIEPYSGVVYDPCCGSGGMFVQSRKFVESHKGNAQDLWVVGQESKPDTWRLCKMNLAIRGIGHDLGTTNGSTFTEDQHENRKVDYIMANPPFNLKNWRTEDQLVGGPRWQGYTIPRVSNANYAWILHMISKLDVNHGIAGFLLANGALNDMDEYANRKQLIQNDKVEAIIVLPRNMFYTTDISVTLWIVNMNKKASTVHGRQLRDRTREVLFVDLRTWNDNIGEIVIDAKSKKKSVILTPQQIQQAKSIYANWQSADTSLYQDIPELCRSVKISDADLTQQEKQAGVITIEQQNYSLAPSKYIEFVDHDLDIDYNAEMSRISQEMKDIIAEGKQSQEMLTVAFKGIGYGIE